SGKALPGPLSSMQCRQARLHSLVICHATYKGAARSLVLLLAARGASAATASLKSDTRRILDEPFHPQLGDEGGDVALERVGGTVEVFLETRGDLLLVESCLHLAHDRGCGRIQREDLLGPSFEQHAAEFFFTELDEFREAHEIASPSHEVESSLVLS